MQPRMLGRDLVGQKSADTRLKLSMEEFILDQKIELDVGDLVVVDSDYSYREAKLTTGTEFMKVACLDDEPVLADLLGYLATVAESVENTESPSEWLDAYGHILCCEATDLPHAGSVYAECVKDMLRLKRFLGDSAYRILLEQVEINLVVH